jgi:hypothetical protein
MGYGTAKPQSQTREHTLTDLFPADDKIDCSSER